MATVVGQVRRVQKPGSSQKRPLNALIADGTGECRAAWFHSQYLDDQIIPGAILRLTGRVERYRDRASFANPRTSIIESAAEALGPTDRDVWEPVYSATEKLSSREIARIVASLLDEVVRQVDDPLPEAIRLRRKWPPRRTAIARCHKPTSSEDFPQARCRLAYDEFLSFQLGLQWNRHRKRAVATQPITVDERIDHRIRRRFPFSLTKAQDRAIREIATDLARPEPMHRLLQADVGAGKTAVAVYAALMAVARKRQVVLLAPTEVLASQHHEKVTRYLSGSRVRNGFLTGAASSSLRKSLLSDLTTRDIDWVIGTHALLEDDVVFADLGLVIIDEQHKFGVVQRETLTRKGNHPHVLLLTATPIPRTLAMTLYGDIDVTTIREFPPGRKPVTTRLVPPDKLEKAWDFVARRLQKGEQAFVVYPLIDESDDLSLRGARAEADRLRSSVLAGFKVELLHGQMKPGEKSQVMERFRRGDAQVLVSTTVIEVGVDVPAATMMLIQHADRFGLSQLHQLRGRVGRGAAKSFCLLFAESVGDTALARLRVLCETNDGFRIAEEDLRIRGPGELLGTRQHGMPAFKAADLVRDFSLLEWAREDAAAILRVDPELTRPEHARLRNGMPKRYRTRLS